MTPLELAENIKSRFGEQLVGPVEFRGEVTLTLRDPERIEEVCRWAKHDCGCNLLLDITGIDNYGDDPRWTMVYELYGIEHGGHLRLKTGVSEEKSELPTVSSVWRGADWHEREVYDMLGHPVPRASGSAPDPDVGGLSLLSSAQGFSAGRQAQREPGVAFTKSAPLEGGPFVTTPGVRDAVGREPRVREPAA